MKTTIDIPDDVLRESMRFTQATTKRDAVVAAMMDFNRRKKVEAFLKTIGTSDTFMSQDELADSRSERGKYRAAR